ncbi:MAG TPA: ABC transporter substrate-binding protein, partial [Terriglobia bacterium]|nr:ABC transporter substrate-binding protein [Terriglobia bacterium]
SSTFRDKNPKVVAAVLAALEEATQMIRDDKKAAVDVLIASTKKSALTAEELLDVISDPAVKFTTTPENVMKYAEFMHSIGTLDSVPSSWKELFFPEIHGAPGS